MPLRRTRNNSRLASIPPISGKPFRYPEIQVLNPGKGLNNLVSDNLIDDREASDLNNIVFVESGCPSKSPGISPWGTGLTNNPKGLASYYADDGTRYMLTMDGTSLKQVTASGNVWTAISGFTYTTSKDVTFTQMRTTSLATTKKGVIFIWNGTDRGTYWTGTGNITDPGTIPSASFSIMYNGIHVCSGTGTQTSRLYLSDPNDATTFTRTTFPTTATSPPTPVASVDVPGANTAGTTSTAALIDINPSDGDKITGLAKFKDVLVVFKERSIYQFTINSDGTGAVVTPIITYLGAVSHKSIDNVDNDVFYLTRLGWFVLGYEPNFFTILRTNELSVRVHPLVDTINATNLTKVASLYKPYQFWSSIPSGGSTTNNLTMIYDKRYMAWSKIDYIHANAFTNWIDSNNAEHLLYAADDSANVFEILPNTYSNNGAAIVAYWQSKAFDGGQPTLYKRWILLDLLFRQITGTIKVTIFADNGVTIHSSTISPGSINGGIGLDQWGAAQFGDSPNTATTTSTDTTATNNVPYRIKINQVSRTLKVKVESDNLNESFILLGLKLMYRPYSVFKFPSSLKVQ